MDDHMQEIKLGKYRHFKGMIVEVIGVALDSETMEEMVVYIHEDPIKGMGAKTMWVRPLKMFTEHIDRGDYSGSRFLKVE